MMKKVKVSVSVEMYNTTSDTWAENIAQLPVPLHHTCAVSHQGKIYVAGGYMEIHRLVIDFSFMTLKLINGHKVILCQHHQDIQPQISLTVSYM